MKRYRPVPLAFVCVQPETKCKDEPPIIFLHGVTGSKLQWKNISQEVANATERKVYVVDARNHGDTEWCDDDFDFDTYANDLLRFMDYVGAPKATLVGHSMGGKTAIRTALTAPERVDKLVIEDMFVKKTTPRMINAVLRYIEWTKEAVELIPLDAGESSAQKIVEDYLYDKSPGEKKTPRPDRPSFIHLKRKLDGRYQHSCNLDVIAKALRNTVSTENIGEYRGPAAFIYGEKSPYLVREDEENIRKLFPKAEFVMIENAGHEVHGAFPKEFIKALLEFLMK